MRSTKFACAVSLVSALAACGGGSTLPTAPETPAGPPVMYHVEATVNGQFGPGLVLADGNGGISTPLMPNSGVNFSGYANGASYVITILTQPSGGICTVTNGSGTISGADVTNVAVNCVASTVPTLTVLAGNMGGPGSADGPASMARLNQPKGLATDSAGNVYVADYGNHAVRKIAPTGVVSTIAGSSGVAFPLSPINVGVDGSGNVFVNTADCRLYKVASPNMVPVTAGSCYTNTGPMAVDGAGNMYIVGGGISKVTPDGVTTNITVSSGALLATYAAIAIDGGNNIYVAGQGVIQKITPAGIVTTVAGTVGVVGSVDGTGAAASFVKITAIAVDGNGTLYAIDGATIRKITSAGVVTTLAGTAGVTGSANGIGSAASFDGPAGIAVDHQGNIYIADSASNSVRKITAAGSVTTLLLGTTPVVGSIDGIGTASFNNPFGIAVDSVGNVFVADTRNYTIRKITPYGLVSTFAGSPGIAGSADGIGAAARFGFSGLGPQGLATDSAGNVYVADSGNLNIREISSTGVVTTIAGPGAPGNLGHATFYWADTFSSCHGGICSSPLGPFGVAVDSTGNIYVADTSAGTMSTITPAGVLTTLGGPIITNAQPNPIFGEVESVVADSAGNAYLADSSGNAILKVTPAGVITTFAGSGAAGSADGVGTAASFNWPTGITQDSNGNLYVVDSGNCTIRKITPAGVVSTVVGVAGQCGFVAGPLPGLLPFPSNVAIYGRTLYITAANGVVVVNNVP